MTTDERIRYLINRLARLDSTDSWTSDLNPTQRAAMEYLDAANRFSRAPSHVAEFLGTTRGTMSQTLKALLRKGYVSEERSESDKRSISYALTDHGIAILRGKNILSEAFGNLSPTQSAALETLLSDGLRTALGSNNHRPFGQCSTCAFHINQRGKSFCKLLSMPLNTGDSEKICVEHQERLPV